MPLPTSAASCVCSPRSNQAFALYLDLVGPISGEVAARLPHPDRADLQQSGFVALLEAIPGIESYLRKRIRGAIVDSIKGRAYSEASHEHTANLSSIPDTDRSVLTRLIAKEQRAAAVLYIDGLPASERAIIMLRARGASVNAIAAVAGVSKRTVKRCSASVIGALRVAMAA